MYHRKIYFLYFSVWTGNSGGNIVFGNTVMSIWLAFRFPRLLSYTSSLLFLLSFFYFVYVFFKAILFIPGKENEGCITHPSKQRGRELNLVNDFHFECSGWLQGPGDKSGDVEGYGAICPGRSTVLERRWRSRGREGEALLMKVAVKLASLEVVAHIVRSCLSSHQSNLLHPSFSVYILIGL